MSQQVKQFQDALYDSACQALERGWNIFPISIHTRKPLIDWKIYQTRVVTQEEVDEWFTNGVPSKIGDTVHIFNLALVTGAISNVVVVDCDNDAAEREAQKQGWKSPVSVKTSRGHHYYWGHPGPDLNVSNKQGGSGRDWPKVGGLDLRGDGGFVVMPPSVKMSDGKIIHTYQWEIFDSFEIDSYQDFKWVGETRPIDSDEFSFATLDLSGLAMAGTDRSQNIRSQIADKVAVLGRKLQDGDGRNAWLIRYAGAMVRNGFVDEDLRESCLEFQEEFFADPLDPQEFSRTLQSAIEMDKRNHPDDWHEGERKKEDQTTASTDAIEEEFGVTPAPIYLDAIDELLNSMTDKRFILEPFVSPGEITQVVGFNGHGKSLFLEAMLVGAAAGRSQVGPFRSYGAPKVLYLDYDNPKRTVLTRFKEMADIFGDTGKNFAMWSPAILRDDRDMQLNTPEGRARLSDWLRFIKPEVVVIDTIRNAFPGMDENSPQDWISVNLLARSIRDAGAAVILVHHRNKPSDGGLGREAGHTSQLTDLDTQVIVTKVEEDKTEAKVNAALANEDLEVVNLDGYRVTPFEYLQSMCDPNEIVKMVQRIQYGKVREKTSLHVMHYIGFTSNVVTGQRSVISTLSPKQMAKYHLSRGMTIDKVAATIKVDRVELERWIDAANQAGQNTVTDL